MGRKRSLEELDLPGEDRSSHERWLREEIPRRWAEHQADPASGIPAEEVHAELRRQMAEEK